ncbi:MAG: sensor histidine kinase [Candidatus Viridilinea halotolerans]|uniref:histidine kinase n=1 Tax=Candidatus Viridilinea halotolerans TaxID=2491704 RepID=A0A426TS22_9CHLR|nr:MAG: sensor histidine kinase [Candidatus Viridilinea halotolerans]
MDAHHQLTTGIAHDLRHEAMGLVWMVEWLITALHDGQTADAQTCERRLQRYVRRQVAFARDLHDVALVTEGRSLPLHPTLVSLSELAVQLVDEVAPSIAGTAIRMSVETRPGVGAAWCDPERTERVLRNLLRNAIAAVKAAGQAEDARITIIIAQDGETLLRCSVVDSGCGIAPNHLTMLTHRFVRVRLPGMHGDGMGMGLTLSAQLVALMGGTLTIDSSGVGMGAVASFTVPVYASGVASGE